MKKRILAIAFVVLMFPLALLLTACGGGQLEFGKNYVYDKAEVVWGSNEEKDLFLSMTEMTEAEFLAGMTGQFASQTLVFNEDGTATTKMSFMGQEQTQTMYYVVDGNTLTMYMDAEKTQSTGTAKIEGSTIVMEEALDEGMTTKIKVVFKVA